MSSCKIKRMKDNAPEMYRILDEFRRVIFVQGGYPDDIMKVAEKALRITRKIDLDLDTTKSPPTFK